MDGNLYLDMDVGEGLKIDGDRVRINVVKRVGRRIRLQVQADKSISVERIRGVQQVEDK